MTTTRIYQGETFTFAVSSEVEGAILDIALYQSGVEVYKWERVDSAFTISGAETAKMAAGTYTLEAKAEYDGRLYTAQRKDAVEIVSAETRDMLLDRETPADEDAGLDIHVSISDANLNLSLSKSEGGGDVTALTKRVAADEVKIANNTANIASLQSGKADKSEIPSTDGFATKEELATKADVSSLDDYALKSEIPSIDNLATRNELTTGLSGKVNTPAVVPVLPDISTLTRDTFVNLGELAENLTVNVTNSLYELAVMFSCGATAYEVSVVGGFVVGTYKIEANKSYIMSICNGCVVICEKTEMA